MVDDSLLQSKVVLCCGEDPFELLSAMALVRREQPGLYHEYRCYRFWKFAGFTLVWSGMGTGCVEPLLFEILDSNIITHIILIGTAGLLSDDPRILGKVSMITEAFLGGAAVRLKADALPLTPDFPVHPSNSLPGSAIISTDYYYGFSQSTARGVKALHAADESLARDVASLWDRAHLVDMETAQFYHFCKLLPPRAIHYLSLKAAANSLKDVGQQTERSLKILEDCLRHALQLLELATVQAATSPAAKTSAPTGDPAKLVEEVKLIWQIQLAVAGVLGYLGTNLVLTPESLQSGYPNIKNILLCGIAILILLIGSMYNLVGSYYTREERRRIGFEADQEHIVVIIFASVYTLVFGVITWVMWLSYAGLQAALDLSGQTAVSFASGIVLNGILWFLVARHLRKLERRSAARRGTP